MAHVKRSPAFLKEIEHLMALLASNQPLESGTRGRIADILALNTTDSGCMVSAKDDEAVFTMIARDKAGTQTIRDWIFNVHQLCDEAGVEPPKEKLADAQECADEFLVYPGRKIPT